jgi:cytochrome c oxidase subunit 3
MNKFVEGGQLALIGFVIVLYVMYTWWRDITATFEDQHTVSIQRGLRLGVILFIVSEIMFFSDFSITNLVLVNSTKF